MKNHTDEELLLNQVNDELNARHQQKQNAFKQRLKDNPIFTEDELLYAARNRCDCGHGLAYPKECGIDHYWDCAGILLGVQDNTIRHTAKLPFMSYDIKSEDQPSAFGATTRGTIVPNPDLSYSLPEKTYEASH